MTFGSLFAGIGGFDLGLERSGMTCKWQVEIDDYATKVLEKHWPHVKRYRDVREVGAHNLEPVDLICGGFPCQDISRQGAVWGKRQELAGERSGLWREYARILRVLQPRFAIVENVAALLFGGIGGVLGDLAACGYDAEWDCLPSCAFGTPHQRDRVFVVAYHRSQRIKGRWSQPIQRFCGIPGFENVRGITDMLRRSDLPEPLVWRNGHGFSKRLDRLGNAVVPQVAEWIGRRIMEASQ